jgi:flagellar biosynthesis protein FlhA
LIDELRRTSPAVVDELIPGVMKLGEVQQVLQVLLREGISIRQLGPILETLADCAPRTREPIALAEHVRRRLARSICSLYRDAQGRLSTITLDPALEERIRSGVRQTDGGVAVCSPPAEIDQICDAIRGGLAPLMARQLPPVVLVSPELRPAVRQLTAARLPQLIVLSYAEITRDTRIESVAMVADPAEPPAAAAPTDGPAPSPASRAFHPHLPLPEVENLVSR